MMCLDLSVVIVVCSCVRWLSVLLRMVGFCFICVRRVVVLVCM